MSSPFGSPQPNQPGPSGGFGTPGAAGPTSGGFGAPNPGGFGAPNSGGFGSPNSEGFGSPAPSPAPSGGFGSPAPAQSGGFGSNSSTSSGFDGGTSSEPLTFRSGPWSWVIAAMVAAVLGLILGLVAHFGPFTATDTSYLVLAVIGWALAGIATFVLLGVYLTEDTKRQSEGPYIGIYGQIVTYRAAAGIGLVAVVVTAIEIALSVSKSGII
ncbi:hypothetical protein [Corynebacterium ulceribovis]|uniref:hypothetical protein n=1 Tax=Corynebacterium ulceribovis TaxID=487732 RepID=UPI000366F8CD|nr:hypothetical protein [Corynebacterium ulceribovis]